MDEVREWMDRTRDVLASGVELEQTAHRNPALRPLIAAADVLIGLEPFWLGSILGQLIARGARAADIRDYVCGFRNLLPLYGCEQHVFDLLIATLRRGGYDDDALIELTDSMTSMLPGGQP